MSKVNFKQKQKKLREQRVRQTGWSEGTWDCSFSDSNEVLQSDEAESPKGVSQAVFDERPKAREKIKKKLEAARHKPDPSVPAEKLSDYLSSLNARDAVPPPILVRDDIPDNVQESTLSKTASRPIFEPAIKKTSKTLSIVEMAGELKKYVHIISYGNTLYYYNNYYYTQLDAKQLIKLYRKYDSIVFVDEGSTFVSSLDFARAIQHSDNYYVLVTREDLSTLPYSVNAILELKKTTSRFKRTYNKAYPVYDSLTASNVQLEGVEKVLTEDANSGYQLFTKIGEKYGIVCISAAGKDNIKQRIFPMKSEKVLVIADGAAFGPQMNDIYAYDPDTEEEAGQCVDEVIQIAEESGAEIQFY